MKTQSFHLVVPVTHVCFLAIGLGMGSRTFAQLKIDYGKSFINVTKGLTGGTIETGDTLEIRSTFVVSGSGANDYVDSCAYFDVVPANTNYLPGSLAILTNEGKIYKAFTDAIGDDAGYVSGTNVRINMGYNNAPIATASRRGRIKYSDRPSFYGATCIMIAAFRVVVSGAYGSKISIGAGTISYYPYGGSLTSITFNPDTVMVFTNYGLCANASAANAIQSESGGTFGSGKAKNRGSSTRISSNYTYTPFTGGNMPNDYYYGISNNTSTSGVGYTTLNTWPKPDATIGVSGQSHRVFNVWDIIGDHTGATNPLLGNPATDTVNNTGGYMAVINSSYKSDIAFIDTISNLCPNTYYKYYAWFRNICSQCGCDSTGKGATTAGYIPTASGDSSGVHPNLTFNINGYDYYTSGNILYSGQWVLKGFTYLTGPAQTSMAIYIRNNAPGGGGNDWAIDDIGVSTCMPSISLTPNKPDTLCQGSDDTVRFKVSAYFANYGNWLLEKSTDGGVTWTSPGNDTTGQAPSGVATPVYNPASGMYEYLVTRYFQLNAIDTKITYRLTIASTPGNISNSNCNFITASPKIVFAVNCNVALPTSISLHGWVSNSSGVLQWTSTNEVEGTRYLIERSDGNSSSFRQIAVVDGIAGAGMGNTYQFTDPQVLNGECFYRILTVTSAGQNYSRTILLSNTAISFDLKTLGNPFSSSLNLDLTVPAANDASFIVYDMYGRIVSREDQPVNMGLNTIHLAGMSNLQSGTYILRVQYTDQLITRRVVKLDP